MDGNQEHPHSSAILLVPGSDQEPGPKVTAPREGSRLFHLWRYRGFLLFLLDFLTVAGAFVFSYYMRFHVEFLVIKRVPIAESGLYFKVAVLLAFVWTFFTWRQGGYETGLRGIEAPMLRLRTLIVTAVYALAVLMAGSFILRREILISRQVILMTAVLACVAMVLARLLFRAVDRRFAAKGMTLEAVVVAGTDRQAVEFAKRVRVNRSAIRILGFLRWDDANERARDTFVGCPILGELGDLRSVYASVPFNTLVLSSPQSAGTTERSGNRTILEVVNFCEEKNISLYSLPSSFDISVVRREVGSFSGMPLIRLQDASLHFGYAIAKRVLDVCVSVIVLLVGLPIWLLIALLVKLTSKGPVLFVQARAGLHGRPFRMYKFRSMVADAESRLDQLVDTEKLKEPVFKIKNDPRVTPVGRFLRRTSLDEIPQMLNVLKGEMTLVGPRPEEVSMVRRYNDWQRRRLKAKPGITGYQQISNRGKPSLAERTKYDLIYLKHQSFLLDLYILAKTVIVVAKGRGVTH